MLVPQLNSPQILNTVALNAFICLSLLSYALGGILDKKALEDARYHNVLVTMYFARLINIPINLAVLFLWHPIWHLSSELMLWAFGASASVLIAMLSYTIAMSMCEASYVLGVTAGYSIVFQFLATLWLGEGLVMERLIGATIMALGIAAIGASGNGKQSFPQDKKLAVTIISLVAATIFWGLAGIFDKKAVLIAHPFEVALAEGLWDMVMLVGLFCFYSSNRSQHLDLTNPRTWRFCLLAGVVWLIGCYSYFFAFSMSSASYVITIISAYPLVMYGLAITLLKESFNRSRILGIILVTIGGILVQLTQCK
jgi:drug/metabolite transporter (DMT)-like permease